MNFIENESAQKLRGGYYTPLDLAVYIARWTLEKRPENVLEPSCGDGVFIQALSEISFLKGLSFTGFEILAEEAAKARDRCQSEPRLDSRIHAQDFLDWAISQMVSGKSKFDAVIGNPPFIRYQYLPEESQHKAEAIFKMLNLPFTKHTNAWVPFVLASISLLKAGGRLGMILPSEIIHVMHAQSLRTYLGNTCSRLLIIDPEEIWFDGTLQGAVILFAEKKLTAADHSDGLGIVKVSGREFLNGDPSDLFNDTARINGKTVVGKWTRALLTESERGLLDDLIERPDVHRFNQIAKVDVGIVTGANKFFLVSDETVERFGLQKFAHPMFGRSEHCPGVIYDERQHEENASKGNPTNFIWLKDVKSVLSESILEYIRLGESQKLHTRYKCRIRKPWYTVPSVYSTKIGMLKRAHDTPRLIYNRLEAFTTDTAYRISTTEHSPEKLIYCFLNSLTALSAELEGRHYGGGVLELVPSEIEKLLVPVPSTIKPEIHKLDTLVRKSNVGTVLEQQNQKVLGALGLSKADQDQLLSAWLRLKNRRQRISGEEEISQFQS
ncbi:MAG: Eco57I restriction-modification methylase domain-containing protein [Methylobacter sp.]